jgi:hypothetical protein
VSRLAVAALLLLVLPVVELAAAPAQSGQPQPPGRAEQVAVHAYKLQYQSATEALMLIHSLLSPRGTVELQKEGNTLVIRDSVASLARIVAVLHRFDRPALPLRLEVYVVRASRHRAAGQPATAKLPADLVRRLRDILPYEVYEVEGQAQLTTAEGQSVTYEIGGGIEMTFRLGAVEADDRIRLNGFRMTRRQQRNGPAKLLINDNLTASLDQPKTMVLMPDEASPKALLLVLTLRLDPAARARSQE